MIQNGGVDQRWNRVSDFDRVGSQVSVSDRCLTRFWILTCAFIMALFLQS